MAGPKRSSVLEPLVDSRMQPKTKHKPYNSPKPPANGFTGPRNVKVVGRGVVRAPASTAAACDLRFFVVLCFLGVRVFMFRMLRMPIYYRLEDAWRGCLAVKDSLDAAGRSGT